MNRQELISSITSHGMDFFRISDLRKLFPREANLNVSVKRMVDAGVIIPLTRGTYAIYVEKLDIEKLATQLYYPSYISFESALAKYGILNQGMYGLTLATTRHSKKMTLAGVDCEYCRIRESLYTGYSLIKGTFLACPEKACLDLLYLHSLGKRRIISSEWMTEELDRGMLQHFVSLYPPAVRKLARGLRLVD